jgi:hypothetical protein
VIAAAPGTIAFKANVDPTDHNCGGMSPDPWNYVGVVHADGRLTLYGHMRYDSLTPKDVGDTVEQGEYLGTAASSGNSNGPHLHFEVRVGSFASYQWVDPYTGPANVGESSWTTQRPYFDSAINRLATHSSPPANPDPCGSTVTHLEDSFATGQDIHLYAYYRDFQGPLPTALSIQRPDGTPYQTWSYAAPGTPFATAWNAAWVVNLPAGSPAGTWRFAADYNGASYETYFNLDAPPAIAITSPNGGERWLRLQPHAVTWTDNLGGAVNVDLYVDKNRVASLASNLPSTGTFTWTPAADLPLGADYAIRVTSVTGPDVLDASDAAFSLVSDAVFANGFE